jgi:hypothetical protein
MGEIAFTRTAASSGEAQDGKYYPGGSAVSALQQQVFE